MTPDSLDTRGSKAAAAMHEPDASGVRYWRRVRMLTGALLLIWALASFGFVFYARELSDVKLLGTPLPFYMAAQGTMLIYLAIIGAYAYVMKKLDALSGKKRSDDDAQ